MKKIVTLLLLAFCLAFAQDGATTSTEAATGSFDSDAAVQETQENAEDVVEEVSLVEFLSQDDRLSTFTLLLAASDLLTGVENGEYTIFAPTNYAFNLATETLTEILSDKDAVIEVLNGHVVEGVFKQGDLTDGAELNSVAGTTLTVKTDGTVVVLNNTTALQADVLVGSSVIHIVDSVIR